MLKPKAVYSFLLVFLFLNIYNLNAQEVLYTNHVGLFNKLSNAENMKKALEYYGFEVNISATSPYRVTVGSYDNRNQALKMEKRLSDLNFNSYIIEIWKEYIEVENTKKKDEDLNKVQDMKTLKEMKEKEEENNKNYSDEFTYIEVMENENVEIEATEVENAEIEENNKLVKENTIFPVENDSMLKGMFASQTLFFFFNKNWEAKSNNYLNLNFTYYQAELKEKSSLTVYLNEKPVHNFKLNEEEVDQESLKIELPKEMIVKGFNSIKILLTKINQKYIVDESDTTDLFIIKDTTAIRLNYIELKENLTISDYPYPFLNIGQKNPINSVFVIPERFTNYHLTSLAYLVAGIGKREPYEELNIKVITSNTLEDYKNHNLVFVGNDKDFKELAVFSETKNENNVIELLPSPWDKERTILWLRGQEEKIIDLVRILFSEQVVGQMKRTKQIINNFESQFNDNSLSDKNITFETLGYGNVNLSGRYPLKALYNYILPAGRKLTDKAFLNIKYRYSQTINFEESSIIIKVNDIPIASKKLSKEGANGDNIICEFPEDLLTKQSFNIEVQFHLGQQIGGENTWAVISNQSYLQMPHNQVKTPTLENYPYLFFKDGTLEDLIMVLSNQTDIYDINMMANIFAYIGRLANNIRDIHVIRAHSLTGEMKDKNIILLGSPADNPIIKQINDTLPISFNQDFTKLKSTNEYFFLEEVGEESGIVQIINSIWNPEKVIVVASAANKQSLRNTDLLLSSLNITPRLSGKATMMDNFGEIYSFASKDIGEESMVVDVKDRVLILVRDNRRSLIILGIMFALIVIISSIVFLVYK